MRTVLVILASCVLAAALSSGCADDPVGPGPVIDEAARIDSVLALHPEWIGDALYHSGPVPVPPGPAPLDAASDPTEYRRALTQIDRFNSAAFSDTGTDGRPNRALVMACKYEKGQFEIVRPESTQHKYMAEDFFRRFRMVRTGDEWQIDGVSSVRLLGTDDVYCESGDDTCFARIEQVQLSSLGGTPAVLTITDPLAVVGVDSLMRVNTLATVLITVTTVRPDDYVVLHTPGGPVAFTHTTGNDYTLEITPPGPGLHHLIVSVTKTSCIFDPAASYNSDAWIVPYRAGLTRFVRAASRSGT